MGVFLFGVVHFLGSLFKTGLEGVCGLGAPALETLFQVVQGRRGDEEEAGVEVGLLDGDNTLHIDIQNALLALLLGDVLDGRHRRAVVVVGELGPLNEGTLFNQVLEFGNRNKMVLLAVGLARARLSSRVYLLTLVRSSKAVYFPVMHLLTRNREPESIRELGKQLLQQSRLARARGSGNNNRSRHDADQLVSINKAPKKKTVMC